MPTIISHAAVPLAVGLGVGRSRISRELLAAGVIASMLPDADVLLFRFGATYDTVWAHRGFTHSIGCAIVLAFIAALVFRKANSSLVPFAFVGLSAMSHGLLDMLTNGGHGIAILWPLSTQRYFFNWHPIQVSPLAASRFFTRVGRIAASEFVWIWVPAFIVALGLRASRPQQGSIS